MKKTLEQKSLEGLRMLIEHHAGLSFTQKADMLKAIEMPFMPGTYESIQMEGLNPLEARLIAHLDWLFERMADLKMFPDIQIIGFGRYIGRQAIGNKRNAMYIWSCPKHGKTETNSPCCLQGVAIEG